MAYVKTIWVDDETVVTADNMNHIEDGIKNLESISLLAVSDTAPSECVEGDLYYNTTTKKIYQAIDTDVWDSEGTDPIDKILYIVFSTKTTYSLDDNGDLISVGGGGAEIAVSTTEPEEDEVLWINPEDIPSGSLNPITNEYSIATDKGYSCNYVNDLVNYSTSEVNTGKKWIDGKDIYRKVITMQNQAVAQVSVGTISNMDSVVSLNGLLLSSTVKNIIGSHNDDSNYVSRLYMYQNSIYYQQGSGWQSTSYNIQVIVEYTKTI